MEKIKKFELHKNQIHDKPVEIMANSQKRIFITLL